MRVPLRRSEGVIESILGACFLRILHGFRATGQNGDALVKTRPYVLHCGPHDTLDTPR
jgi:hypothetical protein